MEFQDLSARDTEAACLSLVTYLPSPKIAFVLLPPVRSMGSQEAGLGPYSLSY